MPIATFRPVSLLLENDGQQTPGDIELKEDGYVINLMVDRLDPVKIDVPVPISAACVPDGPPGGVVTQVIGSTTAGTTIELVVLRRALNAAMAGRPVWGTWSTLLSVEPNIVISHEWRP